MHALGGKLAVEIEKIKTKMEGTQTRMHPRIYPTGSVRKYCNENRRSQPSKIIANMEITTSKSERGKKKRDDSPRAKAMQLCNRISNRIGQKN